MLTVNNPSVVRGMAAVRHTLASLDLPSKTGDEGLINRVKNIEISADDAAHLRQVAQGVSASDRFKDVLDTFPTAEGETPPGFRVEAALRESRDLEIDLVRDIGYDKNGIKRPTGTIFSADTANPYEVESIAPILGNLTCNPGIVYDMFINNPETNVGGEYKNLEQVMQSLGDILGPGCDISVEIEDPFEPDFEKIVDSIKPYEEILSNYRLVVKVPHTGPVNAGNVGQLLEGDKRLDAWHAAPTTEDAFRSSRLALMLRERGYRVNYTLMFEPYQSALAMQAKPYFINSFVRHRLMQTQKLVELVGLYEASLDPSHLESLRDFLFANDYLSSNAPEMGLADVLTYAKDLIRYRRIDDREGDDGLDSVRHNLRLLRQSNLSDTKLIVCSMEGPHNFPDLDNLLNDPEYLDVADRVVITAEPQYLARFSSTNQVVSYQRRFMSAAATAPGKTD